MPLATLTSFAIQGIDAFPVQVEVDVVEVKEPAAATWNIVGLGDLAVREARERVKAALKNSALALSQRRVVVNLAPADVKKEGSHLDLPMALAALMATGRIRKPEGRISAAGELSLEGRLQPLAGALPLAIGARMDGVETILLPEQNAGEAAHVEGLRVIPVATLRDAVAWLSGEKEIAPAEPDLEDETVPGTLEDLIDVKGQEGAKRALEVAAAGGHNMLMIGPPGSGKTMLARRIPGILPPMSFAERIEASKIHSIAGQLNGRTGLLPHRPFRAPHHTASSAALVGGGANPRPGEVSLAHHGVLFLDELPEFTRNALEVLRQPLEDGKVLISRAAMSLEFPARFLLVAAMNPTPSGFNPEVATTRGLNSTNEVQRYLSKISGPLLDRIDIHIECPAVSMEDLRNRHAKEDSATVRARVCAARERQLARFRGRPGIYCNAHMSARELNEFCHLTPAAQEVLDMAMKRLGLSARAYDRLRKLSRTIADLAAAPEIGPEHVSEAVTYRSMDRLG
ncbi:YifB family Mg chelatase-like AAA ATPase [bacterium]|nr:YifB family Mg chelatase-like AAA ATPase [bacterium]